jgi:hypothetical protein
MLRPRSSFELPTHGGGGGGSPNSSSSSYESSNRTTNSKSNSNSGGPYASGGANYGGYNSSSDMMMGMHDDESSTASRSDDDDKYHKKKRKFGIGVMAVTMVANAVFVLLALVFTILWLRVSGQHHGILKDGNVGTNVALQTMVSALRAELRSARIGGAQNLNLEANRKYTPQINKLTRENRFLEKERDELRVKHEGPDKKEEETRMKSREEAFVEQVSLMQQAIKKESKRTILERYVKSI